MIVFGGVIVGLLYHVGLFVFICLILTTQISLNLSMQATENKNCHTNPGVVVEKN